MGKAYVEVDAYFDGLGHMTPIGLWWNDKQYQIDKVLDVRRAPAHIAGALGIRYVCRILGKERRLFYDDHIQKWFVEIHDK